MESEVKRPDVDSVELFLSEIGDRWTFLVVREVFFGVRRFDQIRINTGASPAIVADRIKALVANGVLTKHLYSGHSNRFEYHLSDKGIDLYPIIVLMMRWGDRWLTDEPGEVSLTHSCGTTDSVALRCDGCNDAIDARSMTWAMRPRCS